MGNLMDIAPPELEKVIEIWEQVDPYATGFVDVRNPLEIIRYLAFCMPAVCFIYIFFFFCIPTILHFAHWAPKLVLPKLLGFPVLHQLLRRITHLPNPLLPNLWDIIRFLNNLDDMVEKQKFWG